jgi:hypothetical protein
MMWWDGWAYTSSSSSPPSSSFLSFHNLPFSLLQYYHHHISSSFPSSLFLQEPRYLSRYSDGLRAGRPEFDSPQGQEIFLYSTASRPAVGSTQPPMQWVLESVSPGLRRSGHEADHSPLSVAEIKNGGAIPPLLHMSSWHGA